MLQSIDQVDTTRSPETATDIPSLVTMLDDEDVLTRRRARERLVSAGIQAVVPLTETLSHPRPVARWEAVKVLGDIADPSAAPALVTALEDEDAGVRWLAGEGLIAMGRQGVPALLHACLDRSDSVRFCAGAHHVLRHLVRRRWGRPLQPVLKALDGIVPHLETPIAAQMALYALEERT